MAQATFEPNFSCISTLTILKPSYSSYLPTYEGGRDSVLKHWHIKFKCWGITQKKAYNISVITFFLQPNMLLTVCSNDSDGKNTELPQYLYPKGITNDTSISP
jgi:hypothetical protein